VAQVMIETYSDFSETLQFYRDAGGSSCAVVGDMRTAEAASKQKSGCGARSGCWSCVRVGKDQSAESMIEADPERYGFMRSLFVVAPGSGARQRHALPTWMYQVLLSGPFA